MKSLLLPILLAVFGTAGGVGAAKFLSGSAEEPDIAADCPAPAANAHDAEATEKVVRSQEPKLRDAFLRVLFDHAHTGHFGTGYTETASLDLLRRNLLAVAKQLGGESVRRVLITEIARQAT